MKNKSYNYGQPVEKFVVLTLAQAVALILKLRNSGKVFRADFVKRGDGSNRTMVCRCGVKKYLKGGSAAYSFSEKGLMSVYEFGTGYRSIALDNLARIKFAGVIYEFNSTVPAGEYPADVLTENHIRTIPADTSPMYASI